jgi:hypothetical protein
MLWKVESRIIRPNHFSWLTFVSIGLTNNFTTMATLAASAAAAPSSSLHTKQDDDDASASRNRLEEIRVGNATPRPSTVMAQEFLNNFGSGGSSWKTLPRRLSRLCEQLKNWVRAL